jgi:L-galactose dehydrogenase
VLPAAVVVAVVNTVPCLLQVGIISASPLSMGLLTHQGPPEWHPAPAELKEAAAAAAACCRDQGVDLSKLALQFAVK